jgi:ribosomal protein S18 acetylase RimI-like enzyme
MHPPPTLPADVSFRVAVRNDVPALVRLFADDEIGAAREDASDPPPECYWRAYESIEADPRHELIVAEQDGEICGVLQLSLIPGLSRQGALRGQIESVRVSHKLRGQGIGGRLMRYAIERARAEGCRLVQLTCDRERTNAHRFYERLGFTPSHFGFKIRLD